jgi:predicted HAD superfamily Cof-like phosphohydrolase
MGADGEGAWSEVMSTNFAKIDEVTGKVNKRSDGKILKPKDWESPKLEQYLQRKLEDE